MTQRSKHKIIIKFILLSMVIFSHPLRIEVASVRRELRRELGRDTTTDYARSGKVGHFGKTSVDTHSRIINTLAGLLK